MGLLNKFFGGRDATGDTRPQSSQFHESEATAHRASPGNAPRRELVHVVLRDTMRRHGIPSDWIGCRILSATTREQKSGLHVQFIIAKGQARLLDYAPEFQDSFWEEIEKFDPQARAWLFGVAWQFDSDGARTRSMPGPGAWEVDDERAGGDTQPSDMSADELASDLQALYAIRDAALAEPGEPQSSGAARAAPARDRS